MHQTQNLQNLALIYYVHTRRIHVIEDATSPYALSAPVQLKSASPHMYNVHVHVHVAQCNSAFVVQCTCVCMINADTCICTLLIADSAGLVLLSWQDVW